MLKKTSDTPVFAGGFAQNIGPSLSGTCVYAADVLESSPPQIFSMRPLGFRSRFSESYDVL